MEHSRPKVTVAVGGRFAAFRLAQQLHARGMLQKVITSMPRCVLRAERGWVGDEQIETIVLPEAIYRSLGYAARMGVPVWPDYWKAILFDGMLRGRVLDCDILHVYAVFGLFAMRSAKRRGIVTVLERGSTHIEFQHAILQSEYERLGIRRPPMDQRLVERQLEEYEEADFVYVTSSFVERTFLERGFPKSKIFVVPTGVDLSTFYPDPSKSADKSVFRVVFAGGISVRKGVHYLLEATAGLALRDLEVLLIGGTTPDIRPFLARYEGHFCHINHVPQAKLREYLAGASVLVLPSLEEGFAQVISQAMACGIPVIVSAHAGADDVVRDGIDGFVVPIRDVEALRDRIAFLYRHRDCCHQMGLEAYRRVQQFTWDHYGEAMVRAYDDLLSRRQAACDETIGDDPARFYERYWHLQRGSHHDEDLYRRQFARLVGPAKVVLDVGCGPGENYQPQLLRDVLELHGLDISAVAVNRARGNGIEALVHDFARPFPYMDGCFDGVICIEVLEHLFDPKFCLREIWRVLKPGGIVVVSVPNTGYLRDRLVMLVRAELRTSSVDHRDPWKGAHIRFFNVKSLRELLSAVGFHIETVRSSGDGSVFDVLGMAGPAGDFLAALVRQRLSPLFRGAWLGDWWPTLFAPHVILIGEKPLDKRTRLMGTSFQPVESNR